VTVFFEGAGHDRELQAVNVFASNGLLRSSYIAGDSEYDWITAGMLAEFDNAA
jgi:hypothetical protein